MKTKVFEILTFIVLILIAISCEKNEDNVYINLEHVDFFKLLDTEIVDSISGILNLNIFEFEGITDRWEDDHGVAGFNWIKEGKKYMNSDGHSIILWKDSIDNLTTITYLNYRQSNTDNLSVNEAQLSDYLGNIFSGFGFIQKPNEEYIISESASGIKNIKWYDIRCNQTFHEDTIEHPVFKAELEGDTCKINYLIIPVWYTNLDAINIYLSDNEMEDNAKNFFTDNYEENSDALENKGIWIIYNKLCKAFEMKIVGKRGSYRVFIDIQTGEIVFNTVL